MEELTKLMEELTLSLQKRVEATRRTEELAKEVLSLPKLSVLSPDALEIPTSRKVNDEMLYKMRLQLETQNLNHARESGVETIEQALNVLAQIRWSVNAIHSSMISSRENLLEEQRAHLEHEKNRFAAAQKEKVEILADLSQTAAVLENLHKRSEKITGEHSCNNMLFA